MDYSKITLGQLLSSEDITIIRNAMSILKVLQKCDHQIEDGRCIYCFTPKKPKKCANCVAGDHENCSGFPCPCGCNR